MKKINTDLMPFEEKLIELYGLRRILLKEMEETETTSSGRHRIQKTILLKLEKSIKQLENLAGSLIIEQLKTLGIRLEEDE
jgi:hypothetical protein